MDQTDWKLRVFYQDQIANVARLAREETHPASRKRLNVKLNEYVDVLLAMPRPNELMKGVETTMLPTCSVSERLVARTRPAGQAPGTARRNRQLGVPDWPTGNNDSSVRSEAQICVDLGRFLRGRRRLQAIALHAN